MKLNKTLRTAFVTAAMADVPCVDYDEQAHEILRSTLRAAMPPKLRAVYDDKDLRDFLATTYFSMPGIISACATFGGHVDGWAEFRSRFPDATTQIDALSEAKRTQSEQRHKLENELFAVAASVGTTEALAKLLPEFEKYLPDAPEVCRTLPAVANVVADFTKAGWPKGKKQ